MKLTTYHRTARDGNITQHASTSSGNAPLCSAGPGVDSYTKEWDVSSWGDIVRVVHCRTCLAQVEKQYRLAPENDERRRVWSGSLIRITPLHIEQARASLFEDPSLGFNDPPSLAIDKFIARLLRIATDPPVDGKAS